MRFRLLAMVAIVVGLLTPALAHHSLNEYDQSTLVTVKGTVSDVKWLNPHVTIMLTVRNPDGSTRSLKVEIGPPHGLARKGFDTTVLKVGETVTFEVWMPKDPKITSHANGRELTLSDGRRFLVGDSLMWQAL